MKLNDIHDNIDAFLHGVIWDLQDEGYDYDGIRELLNEKLTQMIYVHEHLLKGNNK
jgi:hypothetical protein